MNDSSEPRAVEPDSEQRGQEQAVGSEYRLKVQSEREREQARFPKHDTRAPARTHESTAVSPAVKHPQDGLRAVPASRATFTIVSAIAAAWACTKNRS